MQRRRALRCVALELAPWVVLCGSLVSYALAGSQPVFEIIGALSLWVVGLGWFAAGRQDIGGALMGSRAAVIVGVAVAAMVISPIIDGVAVLHPAFVALVVVVLFGHAIALPPLSALVLARWIARDAPPTSEAAAI
jgi:hypothetical protein